MFRLILESQGYTNLQSNISIKTRGKRYMLITGDVDMMTRVKLLEIFNSKENMHGQIVRIILITSAGSEGINLFNVRQVHIMEPFWDMERIRQTIGRARRLCSHQYLSKEEKKIFAFRYLMKTDEETESTDQWLNKIAERRDRMNKEFIRCYHRASIDSVLNYEYNSLGLTDEEKDRELPLLYNSTVKEDELAYNVTNVIVPSKYTLKVTKNLNKITINNSVSIGFAHKTPIKETLRMYNNGEILELRHFIKTDNFKLYLNHYKDNIKTDTSDRHKLLYIYKYIQENSDKIEPELIQTEVDGYNVIYQKFIVDSTEGYYYIDGSGNPLETEKVSDFTYNFYRKTGDNLLQNGYIYINGTDINFIEK